MSGQPSETCTLEQNASRRSFTYDNVWISTVAEDGSGELTWGEKIGAKLTLAVESQQSSLVVERINDGVLLFELSPSKESVYKMGPTLFILKIGLKNKGAHSHREDFQTYAARFSDVPAADKFLLTIEMASPEKAKHDWFQKKTDQGSAQMYFHYYGTLQHQQNMLQDYIRTGTYYSAFLNNRVDFEGQSVLDVGAGSGILSLFAAQAGARKVYAVEASDMAKMARLLAEQNPGYGDSIEVVQGRIEEIQVAEKVDVLVSEPIGTLLVNERMLETYIYARDHFLKQGGKMFPRLGRIHVAAFSDEILYNELYGKASFWLQTNFYGTNVSGLHSEAVKQYFQQVVVDAFDPSLLVSASVIKPVDFAEVSEDELYNIEIPLRFTIMHPCIVHGVACWFDVFFDGSTKGEWLSTAPGLPITHWFQLRCVMETPLWAVAGSEVVGTLRLVAHAFQSYDIHATLEVPPIAPGQPHQKVSGLWDLKEPYYRQVNSWWPGAAQPAQQAPNPSQQDRGPEAGAMDAGS
eukprot:evm.model.scf_27.21 EVM.evm.TU.scf_27.21   scf_27:168542-174913(-)